MTRNFARALIVAVFGVLIFSGTSLEAAPIRIGFIAPLSGPTAQHGIASQQGFLFGQKHGGAADQIQVIFEDDGFDPRRSVEAFHKLTQVDHVDVVITIGSGPSNAVAPLAEARGVTQLALAGDPKVALGRAHLIRLRAGTDKEGRALAKLIEKSSSRRVLALCAQNDFTLGVCDALQKNLTGASVERVDVAPSEVDFRALMPRLFSSKVDAIALMLLPGKIGLAAKQLRSQGIKAPLFGGVFFDGEDDIKSSEGALEGASYVAFSPSEEFIRDFGAEYPVNPSVVWAASFADIAQLLSEAVKQGKPTLQALKSVEHFRGALGNYRYVAENGDSYFDYEIREKQISSR